MFWPIYLYLVLSVVIAISAALNVGLGVGFYAFSASFLAFVAGSGLRGNLYGDNAQKNLGLILAAPTLALALWLATGFSVNMFGYAISGLFWTVVGAVVCFVFVNRKLAT